MANETYTLSGTGYTYYNPIDATKAIKWTWVDTANNYLTQDDYGVWVKLTTIKAEKETHNEYGEISP